MSFIGIFNAALQAGAILGMNKLYQQESLLLPALAFVYTWPITQ